MAGSSSDPLLVEIVAWPPFKLNQLRLATHLLDILALCKRVEFDYFMQGALTFNPVVHQPSLVNAVVRVILDARAVDRKSTRLNSSHVSISYAVFCLKK